MPEPDTKRDRRRQTFLRLLAAGEPAVSAGDAAGIPRSTLYAWRRDEPRFRAAWERAAEFGSDALGDRIQSALVQRAIDGVDEPVLHAGKIVGTRKRYSDTLLVTMMREQMIYTPPEPIAASPPPQADAAIEWFGEDDGPETTTPAGSEPAPALSTGSAAPEPAPALTDGAAAPALCWDHLNRAEPEGPS